MSNGNDEVAGLARSVNRAAERIERLVEVSLKFPGRKDKNLNRFK